MNWTWLNLMMNSRLDGTGQRLELTERNWTTTAKMTLSGRIDSATEVHLVFIVNRGQRKRVIIQKFGTPARGVNNISVCILTLWAVSIFFVVFFSWRMPQYPLLVYYTAVSRLNKCIKFRSRSVQRIDQEKFLNHCISFEFSNFKWKQCYNKHHLMIMS